MSYLIIVVLILGIYIVEYPKMFYFFDGNKRKIGYLACHFSVAVMLAGTLFMLYKNSSVLFFELKDFYPALVILTSLGLAISIMSMCVILFKKNPRI